MVHDSSLHNINNSRSSLTPATASEHLLESPESLEELSTQVPVDLAFVANKINWSNVYSSDEESQERKRRQLERESSETSLVNPNPIVPQQQHAPQPDMAPPSPLWRLPHPQEPHRRPLSNRILNIPDDDVVSLSSAEASNDESDAEKEEERRSRSPRNHSSSYPPHGCDPHIYPYLRAIALCTPVKWLFVLFLISCYTTFCLPYPEIRPKEVPKFPATIPVAHSKKHFHFHQGSNSTKTIASTAMLHARASPEEELEYKPGLDRYYEQEVFSNHAWTKYANVWALGTVLAWAVREQHRGARC